MPGALTRDDIARSRFTLTEAVRQELDTLRAQGQLGDGTKTEPRCYVCCEVESKKLVNKLLAAGLTNREIAESCEFINSRRRAVGDNRLIDARHVYDHAREHFKIDEPAQAAYRAIVERHAEQANIDHINGIGTAVSPYAVLHTIMVKGFAGVAAEGASVSVKDLITAAVKIHEWTSADAGQKKMADIVYAMDRIVTAAQYFVPKEDQAAFLAMCEGREEIPGLAEHVQSITTAAVREFAPKSTHDEDDQ
jgi:hypothetical protein